MLYAKAIKRKEQHKLEEKERIARDKQIIDMRKQGMSLSAIGDVFDLTRERVRQIIAIYNDKASISDKVPHFNAAVKKSEKKVDLEKIKALLEEGKTHKEIAQSLGITRSKLSSAFALLRKQGVTIPKNTKCNKINLEVALRMRKAGATLRTIGDVFNVSPSSVCQLFERYK
jgi:DNA-binding CsgD family transcriptional regulator